MQLVRVAIHTLGTRGDVQPYLALALGLKAAGHEVQIAAQSQFEAFISIREIGFAHLPGEFLDLMETPEGKAASLRAGKPTVICPFFGDQPFWGRRVEDLGVGPAPIDRKRLTVEALATAIAQATQDLAIERRASALGAKIVAEDGVGRAVAFLEQRHLLLPRAREMSA